MAKRTADPSRVTVENVNVPGYTVRVDAAKYSVMRKAILGVLPAQPPGLTQDEIRQAVRTRLSEDLFPRGAKAGWWAKMVQLDLEAKGVVDREAAKPLRWHLRNAKSRRR
jgi:hypothetical protein